MPAQTSNEVFYLEDFLEIEKKFTFHLALDRPDPAADAAGVKYTAGFVHQVIHDTYLKDHEAPEDIDASCVVRSRCQRPWKICW